MLIQRNDSLTLLGGLLVHVDAAAALAGGFLLELLALLGKLRRTRKGGRGKDGRGEG